MAYNLLQSTVQVEDLKNPNWRGSQSTPTCWVQESGYMIRLNGVVNPGWVALIGYIQRPTPMASDTDSPDPRIPEFFHQHLKYAAAAWLLTQDGNAKDEKLASEMFDKFAMNIGVGAVPLASVTVKR